MLAARTRCLSLFIICILTLQSICIQAHILFNHHEGVAHSHSVESVKSFDHHHSDNHSTKLDHHHSDDHKHDPHNEAPPHPKEDHEFKLLPYNTTPFSLHLSLPRRLVVITEGAPKQINLRTDERCLHPPPTISHPPQSPRAPPLA